MRVSFDLKFWSARRWPSLARSPRARETAARSSLGDRFWGGGRRGRAVGALLAPGQRKVQAEGVPYRAGGAVNSAAKAHDEVADDPQAATELQFFVTDPLSVATRQFTHEPARIRLILISPSRP